MGISGSQAALMQNRAAIGRAGATRAGYYTPTVVVTINGTDRTSLIQWGSHRVTQALNDEPDTAEFTIVPNAGFTPSAGQLVVIGTGTSAVREFAGQIVRVRHVRRENHDSPWLDVECIDYQRLFDRTLITTHYVNQEAFAIARDIVATYTSGFTSNGVPEGLGTIDDLSIVGETPSAVLRKIASLIGGGFYIDDDRDVHLYASAGEIGARMPTAPQTLTNSLSTLKSFTHTYDVTQVRTRVIVEGLSTTCPIPIVVSGFPSLTASGFFEIPIESREPFETTAGTARVGTVRLAHGGVVAAVNPAYSVETATVAADAATGATSIQIDTFPTSSTTWCKIGEQFIYFGDTDTGPNILKDIPASGQGSVQGPIKTGTQVTYYPTLQSIASTAFPYDIEKDSDVVLYVQVDDAAAQAVVAAIEGGDGIHEHLVQDSRLNTDGCTALCNAELDAFGAALLSTEWETEDMNARPGRAQVINLTVTDAISATLTITRADVTFPIQKYRPRRRCAASVVKLAKQIDVLTAKN